MKKLFFGLVFFVLFIGLSNMESLAQVSDCPPNEGWTQEDEVIGEITLPNGSTCLILFYYCWKDVNGVRVNRLRGVDFQKACFAGYDLASIGFWDQIMSEMLADQLKASGSNPKHLSLSPCPNNTVIVNIEKKECWRTFNNPINPAEASLIPCFGTNAFCNVSYSLCLDYSTSTPTVQKNRLTPSYPYSANCPTPSGWIYNPLNPAPGCFSTCY